MSGGVEDNQPALKRTLSHYRIVQGVGILFSAACLFFVFKTALLVWIGTAFGDAARFFSGGFSEDLLLAAVIGIAGGRFPRFARGVILFICVIYLINFPYVSFATAYLDADNFIFIPSMPRLTQSIWSLTGFKFILVAALLFAFACLLTGSRVRKISERIITRRPGIFAAIIILFLLSQLRIHPAAGYLEAVSGSPLTALTHRSAGTKLAGSGPYGAGFDRWQSDNPATRKSPITPLNDKSPFPRPDRDPLPPHSGKGKGFNVVLIVVESLSEISRKRSGEDPMPNLTRLAANGVSWNRFYATTILTIKSLFAILTGYYPTADFTWISKTRPQFPCPSLGQYFKNNGYRTAYLTSSYESIYDDFNFLSGRGFDILLDADSMLDKAAPRPKTWAMDDRILFDNGIRWILGQSLEIGGKRPEVAEQEPNGIPPQPFFLTLFAESTHYPYLLPAGAEARFPGTTSLDNYHNAAFFVDLQIGKLVETLRSNGLLDSTIIIVVGDHGEAFGQHPNNHLHSSEVYEENIRIPLVISNSRIFPRALSSESPGSLIDLFPTLIDLSGYPQPGYSGDGQSLFTPAAGRVVFSSATRGRNVRGLVDGDYKYIITDYSSGARSEKIFNLADDPAELRDIGTAEPIRLAAYRAQVEQWERHALDVQNKTIERPAGNPVRLTELPILFSAQDWGKMKLNQSILGADFRVGDKTYSTYGFGVHSNSILIFDVSEYQGYTFQAQFGKDGTQKLDTLQLRGEVWVDGAERFLTPPLTSSDEAVTIRVPIRGQRLALVVRRMFTDESFQQFGNWIEPTLMPP